MDTTKTLVKFVSGAVIVYLMLIGFLSGSIDASTLAGSLVLLWCASRISRVSL